MQDIENMTSEDFKNEFLKLRSSYEKKTRKLGSIQAENVMKEVYDDLCADAAGGDIIAQDMLSYWFKHGNVVVPENIETAMKWQIIAAANGNKFTVEKLLVFLNYAYDTIVFSKEFPPIQAALNINNDNYQHILGRLLCEGILDEMKINILELAKQEPTEIEFNSASMRKFDRALQSSVPKIVDYLKKVTKT